MLEKTPIYGMLKRATLLNESVAWFEAFNKTDEIKRLIIELIQQDQLTEKGVDANDNVIGVYSSFTQSKNPKKVAGTNYTLNDTGDLYASMFVEAFRDYVQISADVLKFEDQKWYTDEILGLNDSSMSVLINNIKPIYISYVKRVLYNS